MTGVTKLRTIYIQWDLPSVSYLLHLPRSMLYISTSSKLGSEGLLWKSKILPRPKGIRYASCMVWTHFAGTFSCCKAAEKCKSVRRLQLRLPGLELAASSALLPYQIVSYNMKRAQSWRKNILMLECVMINLKDIFIWLGLNLMFLMYFQCHPHLV